jgi:hypothetical protein
MRRGVDKSFLRFSEWDLMHEPVIKLAQCSTNNLRKKVDIIMYAKV